jgi:hypothetical protein
MVKSVKKKEKKETINLPNITLHVQPMTETITKIKVDILMCMSPDMVWSDGSSLSKVVLVNNNRAIKQASLYSILSNHHKP